MKMKFLAAFIFLVVIVAAHALSSSVSKKDHGSYSKRIVGPVVQPATTAKPSLDANFNGAWKRIVGPVVQPTTAKPSFDETFNEDCLKAHNDYREKHGVPALILDDEISAISQQWAEYLAESNTFDHSHTEGYGENLWMQEGDEALEDPTGDTAVESWYSEMTSKPYVFGAEPDPVVAGHFTQIVWKATEKLGVGYAKSDDGKRCYVVCNYSPPGNVIGTFNDNVPPPV